jgi:triacylglycerol lipase
MSTADELLKSMTDTGASNPYAVSYLQLCQVSYTLPSANIPALVAALPPIIGPGGYWKCEWGPASNSDRANLAYVATYYASPGLPVLTAVVLRGTDFYIKDGWGIVEQVWEDLDVPTQVPMPWAPSDPARIAKGTLDGLQEIQALTSGGETLLDFLARFLRNSSNARSVLVVTGHSLGGCLVSVVAPWLNAVLPQNGVNVAVVPCSFAGPTAGNAAFATYFGNTFPYSLRYHNSLDVVPHAWDKLSQITGIYSSYGLNAPLWVYPAVKLFQDEMWLTGVSYTQPYMNSSLTGVFALGLSWTGELALQHHTTTYMTLLGGQSVTSVPTFTSLTDADPKA